MTRYGIISVISIIALWIISCDKLSKPTDPFIGTWELNKTGNELAPIKSAEIIISKDDVFYVVKYKMVNQDGKVIYLNNDLANDAKTDQEKIINDHMFRFGITQDKHFLVNSLNQELIIAYNEQEDVIIDNAYLHGLILKKK